MPDRAVFDSIERFISTQAHEISHSSGAELRLNRPMENMFGSKEYAKEELVAEILAAFLLPTLGVNYSEELKIT